jgi:hypothetical protein
VQPVLNPEPNRFVCTGPLARYNADNLAEFSRDRGMSVVVLDAEGRQLFWDQRSRIERMGQQLIANADIIIDVIP